MTHAVLKEYSPSLNGLYFGVLHINVIVIIILQAKKNLHKAGFVSHLNVAPQTGLEPVTHGLTVHRSTN